MKIIIIVKTGKGLKSTKKEIDKTVDLALMAGKIIYNKLNYTACKCVCKNDSTTLILEK